MENGKLTAQRVHKVILDCLFKDEELDGTGKIPADAVAVEGLIQNFGFHKGWLESHEDDVREMLGELPEEFFVGKGGGWSFLNACYDKAGYQWTPEHRDMEALFVLGIGLGLVKYAIADREAWRLFPGEVPYIIVDLK